jgi:hypothetical protein
MSYIIDTYESDDWLSLPRVKNGNTNGFLYDWNSGKKIFNFIDTFGNKLTAKNLGDGQIEVSEQ